MGVEGFREGWVLGVEGKERVEGPSIKTDQVGKSWGNMLLRHRDTHDKSFRIQTG